MMVKKKDVVFLPYKASMWDCFHSVYQAAMQDEEWNVVVMPIPYYNLGKNIEILGEYYEGASFPKDITITDYKEYNIEERHPALIFYHNPYDQHNLVTQIPEKYYSSSLKKYCDHLVYIPYDVVCQNINPSRCLMPGVQNAWRIVVENNKVLERYVQYGNISRDKLLALGSPKFDSVLSAMETRKIPEEWSSVFKGKKVFLYNTHLNDLINRPYDLIKKILYLLDFFEEEKEIVLLWRPHPLSMETLKSFQPQFCEIYNEVVEKAKKGRNIVYDDTADLERSIGIADAYMGPKESSVSPLFEITKKPMLYTDVEIDNCRETKRILQGSIAGVVGEKVYLFSGKSNIIGVIDRNTGEIEVIKGCEGISAGEPLISVSGISYEDKMYFITESENYIIKLQTTENQIKQIYVEKEYNDYNSVIWNEKIWFFPTYDAVKIPCIDLDSDEVTYLPTRYEEQLKLDAAAKGVPLFFGKQMAGNVLYRACRIAPIIQKYYFEEKRFEYLSIKGLNGAVRDIVYDGEFFWMILQEGSFVLKWDEKNNQILEEIDLGEFVEDKGICWNSIFYEKEEIYILQRNGSHIVKINVKNYDMICLDCREIPEFETSVNAPAFARMVCSMDDELMLIPLKANGIVSFTQEGNVFFTKTEVQTNEMLKLFTDEQIYNESMCSVQQFTKIVSEMQSRSNNKSSNKVGLDIWSVVRKELLHTTN